MYEGIPGLKTIIEMIIKEKKESWFIAEPEFMDALKYYFPHFIRAKRKQKLSSKLITLDCKRMREYDKEAPKKFLQTKLREACNGTKSDNN